MTSRNNGRKAVETNRTGAISVEKSLQGIKESIFRTHRSYGRGDHLLQLALNEAEALAWQTGFPQLLFPELALEKANSAAAWNRRQLCVQQTSNDVVLTA